MQNGYHSLIKDTISFLKEQKKRYFFAKPEEIPFLQTTPLVKEQPPSFPKKPHTPPSPILPLPAEKKRTASLPEKKEKLAPIVEEKPIRPHSFSKTTPFPQNISSSADSFEEIKHLLQASSPHFALHNEIPDDEMAKQLSMNWYYKKKGAEITLICGQEDPAKITFLKNLAKALQIRFSSACMVFASEIEKENGWEIFLSNPGLKLMLAVDSSIAKFPKLMSFYREIPIRQEHFLNKTPLFLLPDPGLYLKKSSLKPLLWKMLLQKIPTLFEKKSHEEIR